MDEKLRSSTGWPAKRRQELGAECLWEIGESVETNVRRGSALSRPVERAEDEVPDNAVTPKVSVGFAQIAAVMPAMEFTH